MFFVSFCAFHSSWFDFAKLRLGETHITLGLILQSYDWENEARIRRTTVICSERRDMNFLSELASGCAWNPQKEMWLKQNWKYTQMHTRLLTIYFSPPPNNHSFRNRKRTITCVTIMIQFNKNIHIYTHSKVSYKDDSVRWEKIILKQITTNAIHILNFFGLLTHITASVIKL